MSHQENQQITSKFILQSKIDNQKFTVDKKVIDASTLLKNVCDITDINEPIIINCNSSSIEFFISLINQRNEENEYDKKFEKSLFDTFTGKKKDKLIKLIYDLCILDSDVFLDSVADYILGIHGESEDEKEMDWKKIKKYLGLESDFTQKERNLILNSELLEYFLSIDTTNFKFPFPNKNFCSLKTDFSTPMNALLARIIQRSNAETSRKLSLINKTLKNEIDRHPIKLSEFRGTHQSWILDLYSKGGFHLVITHKSNDEKYFNVLKKRKVIADGMFKIDINNHIQERPVYECTSSKFPISKTAEVTFLSTYKSMYNFDVTKICTPSIYYEFNSFNENTKIEFKEIYDHLIFKDLSKKIEMQFSDDAFNFFRPTFSLRCYKKENALKFCKFEITNFRKIKKINPEFKEFLTDYMEEDGSIFSTNMIPKFCFQSAKEEWFYNYPVSVVKESLKCETL